MATQLTLLAPGDDGYDAARQPFNLAVDQRPPLVALPESVGDVAAVIAHARERGLKVAVQGVGHAAGSMRALDGTVLLRTARLGGVEVDVDAGRARTGAGAVWRSVVEPASEAGLAPLAGTAPAVGVTGYTLGGGLGWLGRRHGLACNRVTAAEVVTADGEAARVDADHEPDLFWALRGGGGSFAAVTALEFDLVPAPEVFGGAMLWPWERASEVLHAWREWAPGTPEEVTSLGRVLQLPPLPVIPEPLRGRSFVAVEAVFLGPEDAGAELVAPLRELRPEIDTVAAIPVAGLGAIHQDPEEPMPAISDHLMLAELPGEAIDAFVHATGPGSGSALVSVEIRHCGGALSREPEGAGALGSLEGGYAAFAVGPAMDEAGRQAVQASLARFREALAPWDCGRAYLNFLERVPDEQAGFGADTYARLQEIKRRYDPDDLFQGAHHVPPA